MSAVDPERLVLSGADGNRLVADRRGEGDLVLLLHGGGQTRHAWEKTAIRLAARELCAVTLDLRGHGDSAWIESGAYEFSDFAADIAAVAEALSERFSCRPIVVGASLGGIAALIAEGEMAPGLLRALALVDITPRVEREGVERIVAFMRAHLEEGFGSLEEAAEAVAAYMPHRQRPLRPGGLLKNLRQDPDGRYRWHWDPRFLQQRSKERSKPADIEERLIGASTALGLPVLLVRGTRSELVSDAHVEEFRRLVPHADYVDVSDAGHMVAGDRNDAFADAVIGFVATIRAAGGAAEIAIGADAGASLGGAPGE